MTSLPQYLDGPRFVTFLLSEGIRRSDLDHAQKRRYYEWERGARADIYSDSVDRLLTDHLLLDLIPDDCWADDQAHHQSQNDRNALIPPTRRAPEFA